MTAEHSYPTHHLFPQNIQTIYFISKYVVELVFDFPNKSFQYLPLKAQHMHWQIIAVDDHTISYLLSDVRSFLNFFHSLCDNFALVLDLGGGA